MFWFQAPYRPKIEVVDDDDDDDNEEEDNYGDNDDDEDSAVVDNDKMQGGQFTRLVIDDVTDADTPAAGAGDAPQQRPLTQSGLQSHKLLSDLTEMSDLGFSARGEIDPSVLIPEEVERKEKDREEKIMELATTAGSTPTASYIPYDEDLEGLD